MATIHQIGPFRFDAETGIVFRNGEPLALGQRAVALLLEDLAQVRGIALQLALSGGRLSLRALQLLTEVTGVYSCHLDSPSYQRVVKRTGS